MPFSRLLGGGDPPAGLVTNPPQRRGPHPAAAPWGALRPPGDDTSSGGSHSHVTYTRRAPKHGSSLRGQELAEGSRTSGAHPTRVPGLQVPRVTNIFC